jgi:hypothetical protein
VKQRIVTAPAGFLLLTATLMLGFVRPAFLSRTVQAKPAYMDRYNRDARAKQELINKCTVCHVGRGGDTRNDFGEAFEDAGHRITPRLREKFPKLFVKSREQTP